MKKVFLILVATSITAFVFSGMLWGRGGMGGGGRGGGGGGGARAGGGGGGARMSGGGGARPSSGGARPGGSVPHYSGGSRPSTGSMPSMSRPSNINRPSGAGNNVAQHANRQGTGPRQQMGNLPSPGSRPSGNIAAGTRPNINPNINRPTGTGNVAGNRANINGRPTQNQLNDFLDLGGRPGGGASRPSNNNRFSNAGAIAGGALAGGAAAEFLHDRGGNGGQDFAGGNRPETRPARPGGSDLAGGDNRPGGGDFRPGGDGRPDNGFRPDSGNRPDGKGTRPGGDDGSKGPSRPDGTRPDGKGGLRPDDGKGGLRPDNRPDNRPDGDRRPNRDNNFADYHPTRINNWNQWNNYRHNNWTNINNNWRGRWNDNWHDCNHWWDHGWWNNHPCNGWRWPVNANWWAFAGWGALNTWVPWGWNQPVYYNYGENVYYDNGEVYYGDQVVATADEYAQQAQAIAQSVPPDVQPAAEDWMPLGIFAVTQDGEDASEQPTMFLQLAISKQGILAGQFQNTANGTVKTVEGMVDKETQRAAWTAEGQTRPLMETGIGNLAQDSAGVLVHFANGDTQQWLLTRLQEPKQGAAVQ